jgi:hypothetical protein
VKPIPPCRKSGFAVPTANGGEHRNYTRSGLEQLDRELDRAATETETELGRLEALHTEEWIALFSHALDLDLIGPDDF